MNDMSWERPREQQYDEEINNSMVVQKSVSELTRLRLLRRIVNNKIITARLYYQMLFFSKWRMALRKIKFLLAITFLQCRLRGYWVRRCVEEGRKFLYTKARIQESLMKLYQASQRFKSQERKQHTIHKLLQAYRHSSRAKGAQQIAAKLQNFKTRDGLRQFRFKALLDTDMLQYSKVSRNWITNEDRLGLLKKRRLMLHSTASSQPFQGFRGRLQQRIKALHQAPATLASFRETQKVFNISMKLKKLPRLTLHFLWRLFKNQLKISRKQVLHLKNQPSIRLTPFKVHSHSKHQSPCLQQQQRQAALVIQRMYRSWSFRKFVQKRQCSKNLIEIDPELEAESHSGCIFI